MRYRIILQSGSWQKLMGIGARSRLNPSYKLKTSALYIPGVTTLRQILSQSSDTLQRATGLFVLLRYLLQQPTRAFDWIPNAQLLLHIPNARSDGMNDGNTEVIFHVDNVFHLPRAGAE